MTIYENIKQLESVGQLSANSLVNADCLEAMKYIADKSIDCIIADLPYGQFGTTACKWDTVIPFEPLWAQYKRIIKDNGAIVLFGSQPFTSALVMSNPKWFRYSLVWEKPNPSNPLLAKKRTMSFHEDISLFYKNQPVYNPQKVERLEKDKRKAVNKHYSTPAILGGNVSIEAIDATSETKHPSSVLKFNRQQGLHPTQKPVPLLEYLIKTYTNEGETVLDNTFGSGSTGVAAVNLNRNFIGMEMDDKYFEIAQKRIKDAQTLFSKHGA